MFFFFETPSCADFFGPNTPTWLSGTHQELLRLASVLYEAQKSVGDVSGEPRGEDFALNSKYLGRTSERKNLEIWRDVPDRKLGSMVSKRVITYLQMGHGVYWVK